ncbi:MAG: DMT family transporter [Rhodovibrionaceae bacterium]|nr:DMT family transporter [Rhodovibrionaceae bacterium]
MDQKKAFLAYLAVFIGVLGHASSELIAVLSGVSGPEASVWRYLLGGIGLVVVALIWRPSRNLLEPLRQDFGPIVALSLLGVTFTYLMFHWALDFATVVQVGTIVTTVPIFVGIANLLINRVPLGTTKIISAAAAVIGIILLATDGYLARLAGQEGQLIGIGMVTLCAFFGGSYAILAKPYIAKYGAIRLTAVSLMIGGIGLWIVVGLFFGIWVDPATIMDRPSGQAAALLTLGFWNTTVTMLLWLGGLAAVPDITRGSYLFFLKPVLTAMLAFFFLSQPITTMQIIAIAVILGAVSLEMTWSRLSGRWVTQAR